jgi:hypothetical protein
MAMIPKINGQGQSDQPPFLWANTV